MALARIAIQQESPLGVWSRVRSRREEMVSERHWSWIKWTLQANAAVLRHLSLACVYLYNAGIWNAEADGSPPQV